MSDDPGFGGLHDDNDDEGQVTAPYRGTPTKARTYAMSSMRTSPEGIAFITSVEGRGSDTDGLQWPGGRSGVTIGLGYDLHNRNPSEIISDLTSIGISRDKATILSLTSPLYGRSAEAFVNNNKNLIRLTDYQKQALLKKIIGKYEQDVKNAASFPVTQYQFDSLVALAYNPGDDIRVITRSIASGNFAQAEKDWLSRSHSRSHGKVYSLKGLVIRREREVKLYKTGIYKYVIDNF